MKKKILSVLCLFFLVPIAIILILYSLLTFFYRDKFIAGTWINGLYCTGKTVNEVNDLLLEDIKLPAITITDIEGNVENIVVDDEICTIDYSAPLHTVISKQDILTWFLTSFTGVNEEIAPDIIYNKELLIESILKLNIMKQADSPKEVRAEIIKTESGYILDSNLSPIPDKDKIINKIISDVEGGKQNIQLTEEYYTAREITPTVEETLSVWEKVNELQDCGIIYDMGDSQVAVDAAVISEWIETDENGNIVIENNEIVLKKNCFKDFIEELANEFDTYNVPREFQTTRGDIVTIEKGTYGNKLNKKDEILYLEEAFKANVKEIHTPSYTKEALYKGKNDIGDTYIEVDLTEQTMYYYEDGEIIVETPIVSGDIRSGHKTPACVCYVYNKQTDRILRGPGYASPVDYWMPVNGSIGIHDATWRSSFGKEIYKTNGSHGCINTPYDAMVTLYEKVEIGTPVIMYY